MKYEEIYEKIKNIIADEIHVKKELINEKTNFFEDLLIDELNMLEIIISIEFEFDIDISDKVTEDIITVGDITKLVENNINLKV